MNLAIAQMFSRHWHLDLDYLETNEGLQNHVLLDVEIVVCSLPVVAGGKEALPNEEGGGFVERPNGYLASPPSLMQTSRTCGDTLAAIRRGGFEDSARMVQKQQVGHRGCGRRNSNNPAAKCRNGANGSLDE
jgi:hypothetical protein